jgi:CelD/BcsL family acetyltransferase involved in cellulose biosynthesis
LPRELFVRWAGLQQASKVFESPFFRPEFTQAVAAVRPDARVAVLSERGHVKGFFPFHGGRLRKCEPIGARMSDYHGVICDAASPIDPVELLKACGLRYWAFDHLVSVDSSFDRYCESHADSLSIDLSQGFDAYLATRSKATDLIRQTRSKAKKLAQTFGEVRFEAHTESPAVLRALGEWKSRQYRESGLIDNFSIDWIRRLTENLVHVQTPEFGGILSALYAGDTLVAVHLGLRSSRVWHLWLLTYSREHAGLSPGNLLLLKMAEHAASLGVDKIDFGRGEARYKTQLANSGTTLSEGIVAAHPLYSQIRNGLRHGAAAMRRLESVHSAGRWCRRRLRELSYR